MPNDAVPTFYLYGEPHRAVAAGFIHVEPLDDRSRPSQWTIRPHAHADLVQMFFIDSGGGKMHVDELAIAVTAPALLLVPAGVVHGFHWHTESTGAVLTLSRSYAQTLVDRYPDIAPVFTRVRVMVPDAYSVGTIRAGTAMLRRELGWSAKGHDAAVEAALVLLMVTALRNLTQDAADAPPHPSQSAALVARYRALIERRFRNRENVAVHARSLSITPSTLRAACARIAGRSPAAMLDERAMLEARRALLYTDLPVAAIGYALGFSDPAYFTRFFTRHAGESPTKVRKNRSIAQPQN